VTCTVAADPLRAEAGLALGRQRTADGVLLLRHALVGRCVAVAVVQAIGRAGARRRRVGSASPVLARVPGARLEIESAVPRAVADKARLLRGRVAELGSAGLGPVRELAGPRAVAGAGALRLVDDDAAVRR